jgi:hypothetical protein
VLGTPPLGEPTKAYAWSTSRIRPPCCRPPPGGCGGREVYAHLHDTLTSNIWCHWLERPFSTLESSMTPALLTSMSTRPNSSSARRISACAWPSSVTSQETESVRPRCLLSFLRGRTASPLSSPRPRPSPLRRERLCRRLANAARGACDHCNPAIKLGHANTSSPFQ